MSEINRQELKKSLDLLKKELSEIQNREKYLHHKCYNIEKKLGYYAKNQILYGIPYD